MEKYELAEKDYKKGMKYKDIAEKHEVSINTVKSWKNRYWASRESVHTKKEGVHTNKAPKKLTSKQKEKAALDEVEKKRVAKARANRSGNPNPVHQFSSQNNPSTKHGAYRQFLPPELLAIIEETEGMTIVDRLWFQIETKFASLVHLHRLMFVANKSDILNEISSEGEESVSYKIVYAFEQFESYIRTEARLTGEWRNVVKQFLELAESQDERRMKLEQMQLNIDKTKTDIERNNIAIRKESGENIIDHEDDGFIEALKGANVEWE